ncbi:MAG: SagB/ThcOx family dehydrogenase [Thermodesulforhabdaceae bacterium]
MGGWAYYRETTYSRGKLGGGWWERGDVPSVFKVYPGLPTVSLPRDITFPSSTLEEILLQRSDSGVSSRLSSFSLPVLSSFLFLSYGVTLVLRDERFSFRTVPSAGALYPAELYIAVCGAPELRSGIYNYNAGRHSLTELARLDESRNPSPALQAFVTGIFYRSSCKYRERAFRYVLLDCGHLLEQVFLAGQAVGFHPVFRTSSRPPLQSASSWEDLLAVDPQHEIVLGTVVFENSPDYSNMEYSADPEYLKSFSKVAKRAPVPPSILEVSKATSRDIVSIGAELQSAIDQKVKGEIAPDYIPLNVPFASATLSRRSRRNYLIRSIQSNAVVSFARTLEDFLFIDDFKILFVMERCEESFPNGIYELVAGNNGARLSLLKQGTFLRSIAHASLDQTWLGDAVIHVIMVARIAEAEKRSGPGAYRNLLIHTGRAGQRIYLVSEALGLGCCGVGAFYDVEVRNVLGLPDDWDVLYLLGIGLVK